MITAKELLFKKLEELNISSQTFEHQDATTLLTPQDLQKFIETCDNKISNL